jgi:Ca2+-binding EF-hand superfamily protein
MSISTGDPSPCHLEKIMIPMKTASIIRHLSVIVLPCCLATSCVTYTRFEDETRAKPRFASTAAAQVFYDAYASVDSPMGNGTISVSIAPPMPYWQTKKDTENKKFNAAIKIADANHDGNISEKEARAYAKNVTADRKQEWDERGL